MNLKRKRIKIGIIFILHIIVFIVLYFFHINKKYYGFETSIQIDPFTLEDHNGNKFTESTLKENFHFIYFGFLHCTGICPRGVSLLTRISKTISDSDLRFVYVSIDPERDTVESLKTYIQNRDNRFIGLRDSNPDNIEKFASKFRVQFTRELFSKNKTNYQIDHTSTIFLVNKSLTKIIQYPEGLEKLDQIKKDFETFKSNNF